MINGIFRAFIRVSALRQSVPTGSRAGCRRLPRDDFAGRGRAMLRSTFTHITQASRAVASSSSKPLGQQLHTSAPLCIASERRRQIRGAKQRAQEKRREVGEMQGKAHVVLGHKPGDEAKWTDSELAKVIITEEQILAAPLPSSQEALSPPDFANYGIGEKEKGLLFDVLPDLSWQTKILFQSQGTHHSLNQASSHEMMEVLRARTFSSLVDLRNANAAGIAVENKKRIVAAFSRPGKPGDTGLPEVQAAILTYRIRNVWNHLSKNRKDVMTRRNLRQLVHQRAKILKYLKRLDRDRHAAVLGRLGLEAESVDGELLV
ncbi:hypothetical protein EIP91_007230 [Steccherinum ochraceum]|uniref:Uncharacterized protein n=1 Tax=Steccherinum ochraceum TaxID=92696 RepID=A0A4V2MVF1_9APHY|nr:hypothetical protein EIP91_007230 [Steccherinum ochraceum]